MSAIDLYRALGLNWEPADTLPVIGYSELVADHYGIGEHYSVKVFLGGETHVTTHYGKRGLHTATFTKYVSAMEYVGQRIADAINNPVRDDH